MPADRSEMFARPGQIEVMKLLGGLCDLRRMLTIRSRKLLQIL